MFKIESQSVGPCLERAVVHTKTEFVELVGGRRVSGIPTPIHGVKKPTRWKFEVQLAELDDGKSWKQKPLYLII